MEEEIQEKKTKKNTGFKRAKSQGQKQQKQDESQNNQSQLQSSNISFKPKSSLIQKLQVQEESNNNQDQTHFESILKEQKIKKSSNRTKSADTSTKKKFTLNTSAKKKVKTEQLKIAKEIMKEPLTMSSKQSTEIDAQDIDLQQLKQKQYDQPQVQKKKKFKREAQINTIIDARYSLNEEENAHKQENSDGDNSMVQDYEEQMQQIIEEKYGTLLEPNIIPFPKDEKQKDEQYEEGSLMHAYQQENYVLMQFPTKFLYDLKKSVELKNRIKGVNRDNLGDNKEILNMDVQRKYDSAGNKILQFNNNINHYIEDYQKLDIKNQNVGYKMGKMVIKKNGECKFVSGENTLDVQSGISSNCLQEIQTIDLEQQQFYKISNIRSKFVVKPDINELYNLDEEENTEMQEE